MEKTLKLYTLKVSHYFNIPMIKKNRQTERKINIYIHIHTFHIIDRVNKEANLTNKTKLQSINALFDVHCIEIFSATTPKSTLFFFISSSILISRIENGAQRSTLAIVFVKYSEKKD